MARLKSDSARLKSGDPAQDQAAGDDAPQPTPRELGFRMPAEWEPHEATWLAWPHNRADWPGKFAPIPWVYAEIVRHLARVERVRILVADADERARARRILAKTGADLPPSISSSCPPIASGRATTAPSSSRKATRRTPAASRSPTGASTPGPSTTTGQRRRRNEAV